MPIIIPSPRTGKEPQIHQAAFIAPTAVIIGDVKIEKGANIWFGAVLRGDWGQILVGENTSIQENVVVHVTVNESVIIGANCIIGHSATIHGPSEIGNNCLVGIGANVLHNSKLGEGSILGAGAVLVNKEIPPRTMAVGVPAEIKNQLPNRGGLGRAQGTTEYAKNGQYFKEFFEKHPEYINF
jgi:carbonic anhydrase/acetyltransferase-like protein (isoleucine patch superfamily)